jgi:hypothetical protein
MSLLQLFKNHGAFRAGILMSALLSPAAHAENAHLVTLDGGSRTAHGLAYTITSDQLVAVVWGDDWVGR